MTMATTGPPSPNHHALPSRRDREGRRGRRLVAERTVDAAPSSSGSSASASSESSSSSAEGSDATPAGAPRRRARRGVRRSVLDALAGRTKSAVFLGLLISLVYLVSRRGPPRRSGLGAGAAPSGELRAALRRKGDGRAAVAIVRVAEEGGDAAATRYLVQVKSHDYPIAKFRGAVCLLGGNAAKADATPLDTLKRELREELGDPAWVSGIGAADVVDDARARPLSNATAARAAGRDGAPRVRYLGASHHFQSASVLGRATPYSFVCALYEIELRPDQLPPRCVPGLPRGAAARAAVDQRCPSGAHPA